MKKEQRREQSPAALAKSHLAFVLALALATVATGSAAQFCACFHVMSSTTCTQILYTLLINVLITDDSVGVELL